MFHASSMNRLRFRTKDGFDRAASWLTGSRNESREMISFEYSNPVQISYHNYDQRRRTKVINGTRVRGATAANW